MAAAEGIPKVPSSSARSVGDSAQSTVFLSFTLLNTPHFRLYFRSTQEKLYTTRSQFGRDRFLIAGKDLLQYLSASTPLRQSLSTYCSTVHNSHRRGKGQRSLNPWGSNGLPRYLTFQKLASTPCDWSLAVC
jgi:hypothetical protein